MINEVQYNGNGTVTFVDFCNLMFDKLQDADTKKELEEAFKLFDKEGNGQLSIKDLRHILKSLAGNIVEEDIEAMV